MTLKKNQALHTISNEDSLSYACSLFLSIKTKKGKGKRGRKMHGVMYLRTQKDKIREREIEREI